MAWAMLTNGMIPRDRKMALAALTGRQSYAWRQPDKEVEKDLDFDRMRFLAQLAEKGKFDIFFLADGLSVRNDRMGLEGSKGFSGLAHFEAITLISALAAVTSKIGLAATISATYNEPYHVARKMASLDHISGGRAGWNVVTSGMDSEAFNFGLDEQRPSEVRYERAREFIEVVFKLWDSWDDDAIVQDRTTNTYFDPKMVHPLNHQGKHFKIRGALNILRPPQGHPIICQAGGSDAGWEMAAESADVMYGKAIALKEAQRFYADIKGRMSKYGRTPDQLKFLPGLSSVVGRTEKEAREKFRAMQDLLTEDELRHMVSHVIPGIDFSNFELDEPIPSDPAIDKAAKKFRIFLELDGRRLTLREVADYVTTGIGHLKLIGSPGQIADTMVKWFDEHGCDGFNIMGGLEDFVEYIVPELQERGVFRTEYEFDTLRENLGLARPESVWASHQLA